MKINSINLNKNYKALSFKTNESGETTNPVQTVQIPAPTDVLQFKSAIKVEDSLGTKIVKLVKKFLAEPANSDPSNWSLDQYIATRQSLV